MSAPLLHKSVQKLLIGQLFRFEIAYRPYRCAEEYAKVPLKNLWLRVRNLEPLPLRAAYLAGPYTIYVDCRPLDYNPNKKTFITADQPLFEPQLHPGQTFWVELPCHVFRKEYRWTVDVVSQIVFNTVQLVSFDVCIATGRDMGEAVQLSLALTVSMHDTLDVWNLPLPDPSKPLHLVILTHGLHSNVSADLLSLKEVIDRSGENVVVKGFFGNVCKTERGIKYLGSRVAECVVALVENKAFENAAKISFIGHSLGGPVQTFAIAYIEVNYPWVFRKLQPTNFITLASPMLGVTHDNPAYVKMALLAGIAGRTGHDLGLQLTKKGNKPLLLLLPSGPTHRVLKRFERRTVYANVFNDGIVPLRTAALLYLDYQALAALVGPEKAQCDALKPSAKIPRDLPASQDSQSLFFLAVMSFFMPRRHGYGEGEECLINTDGEALLAERILKLPKPLMLESAASLLLPPLPPRKFLSDPDSRENVVVHDKMYHECDLPKQENAFNVMLTNKSEELWLVMMGNMTEQLEEAIAREYHKSMLWRKVLVKLRPEAHNNIAVRRRFSNAYGWPVLDHLVANHFGAGLSAELEVPHEDSLDSGADSAELAKILSIDAIRRENAEVEKEPLMDEHAWTQLDDEADAFDGPAGIFCDISERMVKMKNDWNAAGLMAFLPAQKEKESMKKPGGEPLGLMADFI
ncbi:DUF676-domain-containing protein [Metschnikowia bicuspidata]|uniref:DUF676-domain-containing protein n=1 Tax=Metschnikowia bicuspidata TaxID=27322 RepID=A0A4P9ZF90_9ASCO|nr:DUF676-domain-containing protein [Metschnikowia bicuspidata]